VAGVIAAASKTTDRTNHGKTSEKEGQHVKPYLNGDQQNEVVLMGVGIGVMEKMAQQDKFQEAHDDLIQASLIGKSALKKIRECVDEKSFTTAQNLASETKIILKPLTSPEEGEIKIKIPRLHDLHMLAIGNTCRGCERKDYKKCPTRELLLETHCPFAQDTIKDCPYRQ